MVAIVVACVAPRLAHSAGWLSTPRSWRFPLAAAIAFALAIAVMGITSGDTGSSPGMS